MVGARRSNLSNDFGRGCEVWMKKIIVTLTNENNSFFFDMELPTQYPVAKMCSTIVDLLNQNQSKIVFKVAGLLLVANRQKKIIPPNNTLEEAGIWNGDYITVIPKS